MKIRRDIESRLRPSHSFACNHITTRSGPESLKAMLRLERARQAVLRESFDGPAEEWAEWIGDRLILKGSRAVGILRPNGAVLKPEFSPIDPERLAPNAEELSAEVPSRERTRLALLAYAPSGPDDPAAVAYQATWTLNEALAVSALETEPFADSGWDFALWCDTRLLAILRPGEVPSAAVLINTRFEGSVPIGDLFPARVGSRS